MNENEIKLINEFFEKSSLTETEVVIKDQCLALDQSLNSARQELQTLAEQHATKQAEVVTTAQQLEGVLKVVLELAKKQYLNSVEEVVDVEVVTDSAEG